MLDKLRSLNKKQLVSLIVFLLILLSIPIAVYLASKTQIFKPRADTTNVYYDTYELEYGIRSGNVSVGTLLASGQ